MKKIDITYFAFSRMFYETFDASTPLGEVHDKLRERCQTYHITNVSYRNIDDNKPINSNGLEVKPIIKFFIDSLLFRTNKSEITIAYIIVILSLVLGTIAALLINEVTNY